MAWTTPKTDWVSTDHYDYRTFNRIEGNLAVLDEQARRLFDLNDITERTARTYTYSEYTYPSFYNKIESWLYDLNRKTWNLETFRTKKTYLANQPIMDYAELNRVESTIAELKALNDIQLSILPTLAIRMGDYERKIKV